MDLNYKHYLDSMKMKQCIKKRIESVLTNVDPVSRTLNKKVLKID